MQMLQLKMKKHCESRDDQHHSRTCDVGRQDNHADSVNYFPNRLVGNHLLSADPVGYAYHFGPIQWAFSLLPKWEGAWAKWIIRYLTVHFYGAMLYFVGFYVLLLFDIVINIQYNDLAAVTASDETVVNYLQNAFFSAGYLMAASVVALKCLNLVPDLAAWMIPEGDTAFSTRSFGEGVATSMRQSAGRLVGV